MVRHVLYIRLEAYHRQWVLHKYGEEPVVFKRWSHENGILKGNLRPKPEGWMPVSEDGCIAVSVPKVEGLNSNVYCYVPEHKLAALKSLLKEKFLEEFLLYIKEPHTDLPTIKSRVLRFMAINGIEDDKSNLETLLKIYQRNKHLLGEPDDIDTKANKAHKGVTKRKK